MCEPNNVQNVTVGKGRVIQLARRAHSLTILQLCKLKEAIRAYTGLGLDALFGERSGEYIPRFCYVEGYIS